MATRRSLRLAADLAEVARLNRWFDALVREAGLAPEIAGDLKLCLDEAVANVVGYGFPDGRVPEIEVGVTLHDAGGAIEIVDNGIAFDPLSMPQAPPLSGFDDDRIGGFGITLIRSTASRVAYDRRDGRNRLRIECGRFSPADPDSAAPDR